MIPVQCLDCPKIGTSSEEKIQPGQITFSSSSRIAARLAKGFIIASIERLSRFLRDISTYEVSQKKVER